MVICMDKGARYPVDTLAEIAMIASQKRYREDARFRALCQSAVNEAINEHGRIDPDRADEGAYYIALRACTVALHRAFEENAELKAAQEELKAYKEAYSGLSQRVSFTPLFVDGAK